MVARRHYSRHRHQLRRNFVGLYWTDSGCGTFLFTLPDKNRAVALRQRLNILREKMRKDDASPALARRAKLHILYTKTDNTRHRYSSMRSCRPLIRSRRGWLLPNFVDFKTDHDALVREPARLRRMAAHPGVLQKHPRLAIDHHWSRKGTPDLHNFANARRRHSV